MGSQWPGVELAGKLWRVEYDEDPARLMSQLRALAEQLAGSANRISKQVKALQTTVTEVTPQASTQATPDSNAHHVETIGLQAEEVVSSALVLSEVAHALQELSQQICRSTEIQKSSTETFAQSFCRAHQEWVARAEAMLSGGPAIAARELSTHTECFESFGGVPADWKRLPAFKRLDDQHREVHRLLAVLLVAQQQRQTAAAQTALAELTATTSAMTEAFQQWLAEFSEGALDWDASNAAFDFADPLGIPQNLPLTSVS